MPESSASVGSNSAQEPVAQEPRAQELIVATPRSSRARAGCTDVHYPPIPSLDAYLGDVSYRTLAQSGAFEDMNLSGAAAGFVTYQPLTMLFRRWPFRIFIFVVATYFTLYALAYGFGYLTPDVVASYNLTLLATLSSAVPGAIMWVAPFVAMCGHPRLATITVGTALALNALLLLAAWAPAGLAAEFYEHFADTVVSSILELILAITFLFKEEWWRRTSLVICGLCFAISAVFLFGFQYLPTVRKLILPATIWLVMVLIFLAVRWWSLKRADAATKPDLLRYNAVWEQVEKEHKDELIDLATVVSKVEQSKVKVMQPLGSLGQIYKHAFCLNDWYQAVVQHWAAASQGRSMFVPVKSLPRTLEKVHRSYMGKIQRVLDVVRSTIVVDDICCVSTVLQFVMKQAILHQVKNRFDLGYDSAATAGYRDLNCQLSFVELVGTPYEGFVFELQIHYAPVLALKSDEGHKRYICLRNLRGD